MSSTSSSPALMRTRSSGTLAAASSAVLLTQLPRVAASPALAQPGIPSRTIVRTPGLLCASEVDFSQPFRAVTPTLDGSVPRVLARTTHPLTRQQVADLVGKASEAGVRKVLRRLAQQGVVIEQRTGRQYPYVGNRLRCRPDGLPTFPNRQPGRALEQSGCRATHGRQALDRQCVRDLGDRPRGRWWRWQRRTSLS